jgi:polyisoprenoid-binding protein YceI
MTNYPAALAAVAVLSAGACSAAESPAANPAAAAKPAPAKPAAAPVTTATRYTQARGSGSLTFAFMQAGAENHGSFRQFDTELAYDAKRPEAGTLKVTVQTASLDTQDKDRNDMLAGADLFDVQKYPTAQYLANAFARSADGRLEAVGKLTLRGVTRDLRIPLTIRDTPNGVELSGEVTIERLDYGVGQGEWQATDSVGNAVKVQYKVPLAKSNPVPGSK